MTDALTIITYHYVRDLKRSRYPDIKGRTIEEFAGQLAYLRRHYELVGIDAVRAARDGHYQLPPNAAVLTFDDGYVDHYTTVLPLLHEVGVQGWFFPVVDSSRNGRVLDVNKIHFLLASVEDKRGLAGEVLDAVNIAFVEEGVEVPDHYWVRLATPSKWDIPEVAFVKRLLQQELPRPVRRRILDDLFRRHVTSDEEAFANELYLDEAQLRMMLRCSMYIGSHGVSHQWMDRLTPEEQTAEIAGSRAFLEELGADGDDWVMCYPYGRHDRDLVGAIRHRGCGLGLTTARGLASLGPTRVDDPLLLPRLDTKDLPVEVDAPPAHWTNEVAGVG